MPDNIKKKIPAIITAFMAVFILAGLPSSQVFAEDNRELITVAPDIKDRFLSEMREDLGKLSEILSAIAEGDFKQVARIAERRMGLGHSRIEKMENMGATDEQIAQEIKRIRKMAESEAENLPVAMHKMGRAGRGIGRFMPPELRAIGQESHKIAYELADAARAVKTPPTSQDYQRLFSILSDMTTACRGCHEAFRVR